ncbi:unnamed protein product [Sphagnum tenellum]
MRPLRSRLKIAMHSLGRSAAMARGGGNRERWVSTEGLNAEIAKAAFMDVKVSDFGISKIINATTTISPETLVIGTTGWMAPEVMSESEEDSSKMNYPLKSDVYGYAMMCYGNLWRRTPFQELCLKQLGEKVKAGLRPTLPKSPPTSLSSLIKHCWGC